MEPNKRKKIYDEAITDNNDVAINTSRTKESNNQVTSRPIKPIENAPVSNKKIDNLLKPLRKVDRAIDNISRPDYKEYKRNTKGIDDISKLSNKELVYALRDYKIDGKDISTIKTEMNKRVAQSESIVRDQNVQQLVEIKTDKGNIKVGYDQKKDSLVISETKYNNNPNINIWRNMEKGNLTSIMINKGELNNFDIISKSKNMQHSNISNEMKAILNNEISNATSKSQGINFTKELTSTDLRNPDKVVGTIINTAEQGKKPELYKVLQADDKNMTLRGLNTEDQRAFMVSVSAERNAALGREVQLTGIIDDKTVLGFNQNDKDVYIGKVNPDQTIDWAQKGVYLNNMDKDKKQNVTARIENGDYIRDNVKTIGIIENGNSLYGATNGNKETLISANQSDWFVPDSIMGKQLASLAGLETGAISAIMNIDKTSQLVNSNQMDNGLATAAESRTNSSYSQQL